MKKFLALILSLSMTFSMMSVASAANITTDGGTGSADVVVTVAEPTFSVTVPMSLPVTVAADGTVTVATDAKIVNGSHGMVRVTGVTITGANTWSIVSFTTDMGAVPVNSKKIGFKINNEITDDTNPLTFAQANWPDIAGKEGATDGELNLVYDAVVPAQSTAITSSSVANVVFTIGWATKAP